MGIKETGRDSNLESDQLYSKIHGEHFLVQRTNVQIGLYFWLDFRDTYLKFLRFTSTELKNIILC